MNTRGIQIGIIVLVMALTRSVAFGSGDEVCAVGGPHTTSFSDADNTTGHIDNQDPQVNVTCPGTFFAGDGQGPDLSYFMMFPVASQVDVTMVPTDTLGDADNLVLYIIGSSCHTGFFNTDCIAGSDNGGPGGQEFISFHAEAGVPYFRRM